MPGPVMSGQPEGLLRHQGEDMTARAEGRATASCASATGMTAFGYILVCTRSSASRVALSVG